MLLSYYIYFVEEMIVLRYHVPNYNTILSSTREIDLGETGIGDRKEGRVMGFGDNGGDIGRMGEVG